MSAPIKAKIEADKQNEQEETRPVVVRTLKDPPEIWDLVHEAPANFNPTGAFVNRLTTSKGTAFLALVSVLLIVGLAAFAIMKLTGAQMPFASVVRRQLEATTSTSQAATNASTSKEPITSPTLNTAPTPESVTNSAATEPIQPQPTAAQSTDSTVTSPAPAESAIANNESPAVTSTDASKRVAARRGVRPVDKQVTAPPVTQTDGQSADYRTSKVEARTNTPSDSTQKRELEGKNEKSASDSTRTAANPTLSPQLIAPPAASPSPKGKVIQWP